MNQLRTAGLPADRDPTDGENERLDTTDAGIDLLNQQNLLHSEELAGLVSDPSRDGELTEEQIEILIAKLEERTDAHNREAQDATLAADEKNKQRVAALAEHQKKLESILQSVNLTIDNSQRNLGPEDPQAIANDLQALLHQREIALQEKYKELHAKEDEDKVLTEDLRRLQRRVQDEVPQMTLERDQQLERITREWERDMQQLELTRQQERQKSMSLLWHVNRGTHIRPEYKDPRKKGTFGTYDKSSGKFVEDPHADDRRLKAEEEKLLIQHNEVASKLRDLDAEKVLVQRRREAIAAQWDAKPAKSADGKVHPPNEGTKLWYDQEIARLKQRCTAEEKVLKEMVKVQKELKDKRIEADTNKKQITRGLNEQLIKLQRNAHRKTSPGPAQITAGKTGTAGTRSVTAPPSQETNGATPGKAAVGARRRPAQSKPVAAIKGSAKG